ncbi:DNA adenine methylase [Dyadobacter fanqingshengii]|uniref:DNA adenine methylase n=1 Tax=Dyadobacter fanqingshengii TaxID=2906443 RepID=UPI0020C1915B|nr:DNA adenine methylase [Dyadobacter fanqingshengii]UTM21851.1 DNA adenine methylase [Dyadobacter fanqingshengii]
MPEVPHIIKYMGSKRNILDFVTDSILEFSSPNQRVYDVFGGSAVVAGSLRNLRPVCCNDIQQYTSVIAKTYLNNYYWSDFKDNIIEEIVFSAQKYFDCFIKKNPGLEFSYSQAFQLENVIKLEKAQQDLINREFSGKYHLFTKNYSGTYWSFEQCLWIDSIMSVAKQAEFKNSFIYDIILSALMFAMAYTTIGTGHYAQYRDLTAANLEDILFYRKKSLINLFTQKFVSLKETYTDNTNSMFEHQTKNLDYTDLLNGHEDNSIVYADPPYQFVHYSRFYHALETLVRYDYPSVAFKGRYRTDRHQSPFCIRSEVKGAFTKLFQPVLNKNSTLIISYSDNGMISFADLLSLGNEMLGRDYRITDKKLEHTHSTMGRQGDKSRIVNEVLIICQPKSLM